MSLGNRYKSFRILWMGVAARLSVRLGVSTKWGKDRNKIVPWRHEPECSIYGDAVDVLLWVTQLGSSGQIGACVSSDCSHVAMMISCERLKAIRCLVLNPFCCSPAQYQEMTGGVVRSAFLTLHFVILNWRVFLCRAKQTAMHLCRVTGNVLSLVLYFLAIYVWSTEKREREPDTPQTKNKTLKRFVNQKCAVSCQRRRYDIPTI